MVLTATIGGTLGKVAMGYNVVDGNLQRIGLGRSLVRYVGKIVSALVILLGFIWVAFDAKKQGWHDKIAGTYVVRKENVRLSSAAY